MGCGWGVDGVWMGCGWGVNGCGWGVDGSSTTPVWSGSNLILFNRIASQEEVASLLQAGIFLSVLPLPPTLPLLLPLPPTLPLSFQQLAIELHGVASLTDCISLYFS